MYKINRTYLLAYGKSPNFAVFQNYFYTSYLTSLSFSFLIWKEEFSRLL